MQYKVTRQYARDIENPLAEFRNLSDAKIFIEKKSFNDDLNKIKLIYRLFDNNKLIDEFNLEKIHVSISRAQYAKHDRELPDSFLNKFKVLKELNIHKKILLAEFDTLTDARIFISEKLDIDAEKYTNITYRIFEHDVPIEIFNQDTRKKIKEQSEDAKAKSKGVTFKITPFSNISPRPPGARPSYLVRDENKDDDNDESDNNT